MGATATGKSQMALYLAELLPCDLISVDSVLVYRHMNIGTAKPDPETLERIPHHLIDIRDPNETYSVGNFLQDVQHKIENSLQAGRIPLLVGGTMLYFHLLKSGLAEIPHNKQNLVLKKQIEATSLDILYQDLKMHDPVLAKKIHPNDTQRIQRAIFVYQSTGRPLSHFQKDTKRNLFPHTICWLVLQPENRESLKIVIKERFQTMLKEGFVEEVEHLYRNFTITEDLPAAKAVGYRQVRDYLLNQSSYEVMQTRAIYATFQLAKRQFTWLRHWSDASIFKNTETYLIENIKQKVLHFLDKDAQI